MDSYHKKIMKLIHDTRRDDVLDTSSGAMEIIAKFPSGASIWW